MKPAPTAAYSSEACLDEPLTLLETASLSLTTLAASDGSVSSDQSSSAGSGHERDSLPGAKASAAVPATMTASALAAFTQADGAPRSSTTVSSESPPRKGRTKQTARKSTGGKAPRRAVGK
jgi:hypothetical protein